MIRTSTCILMALASLFLVAGGCETYKRVAGSDTDPRISIEANPDEVTPHGTALVTASTHNTVGRQATIRWSTTMGTLKPQNGGSQALFTAGDVPGKAIITAELLLDGVTVTKDQEEIEIRQLKP